MSTQGWNAGVIEEFRANGGQLGGQFAGAPVLLLTTTGAKSRRAHVAPMMYLEDGGVLHVFASKAGAPDNPDWYHNLVAHPEVTVEMGTESFEALARVLTGAERDRVYARQAERYPMFAEYQEKTSRRIPVIALERAHT